MVWSALNSSRACFVKVLFGKSVTSFFTDVSIVGVVGGDFTDLEVFETRGIGTRDLERIEDGKTFRWGGKYEYDLNVAHTLFTDLNVFAEFQPKVSEESKRSRLLFLGNIQPDLQRGVREQQQGETVGPARDRDSQPGVFGPDRFEIGPEAL